MADVEAGFYWIRLDFGGWVPAERDCFGFWHPAGVDLEASPEISVLQVGAKLEPPICDKAGGLTDG